MGPDDVQLFDYGGLLECRLCGAQDLHWGQLATGKWVLVDSKGRMHVCPVRPLKVEDSAN